MSEAESGGAVPGEAWAGEGEAWAEVERAWRDEACHRAYLDRFHDLEGLAIAGRRYRDALARDPRDPVALRGRDEVLRRATAAGLAQLPRTPSPAGRPRGGRLVVTVLAVALTLLFLALAARQLAPLVGGVR
jgi:hypothetical protein